MAMLNNQMVTIIRFYCTKLILDGYKLLQNRFFCYGIIYVHSPAKLICDVLQGIWLAMCDSPALVAVAVCFFGSTNQWKPMID